MNGDVLAVIQARLGSRRLPRKVLEEVGSQTMLEHVLERAGMVAEIDRVVVATSDEPDDNELARFCLNRGVAVHRGPLLDVLGRFHGAARQFGAGTIVRLTADCPLLCPAVVSEVLGIFGDGGFDYATNGFPECGYPRGLNVEVFRFDLLKRAHTEAVEPYEREHVTPWMYASADGVRVGTANAPADHSGERWTVDTPEDLAFVRAVFDGLTEDATLDWTSIVRFLDANPSLRELNAGVSQKHFTEVQ